MPGRDGKKKVLITGAAGPIGRSLRFHLRDRYDLRLMVHRDREEYGPDEDVVTGDFLDLTTMSEFVEGCDAVVHLAKVPDPDGHSLAAIRDNLTGSHNIAEACRVNGVRKIVFASTNHVTGMYEREGLWCDPDIPVRPDGFYGAGKAAVEALYRHYSDNYGLSIIALRIGSFLEQPTNLRSLATWLSPADMAQLTWRSIESDVPWLIVYGISGNTRRYWSIENAQRLLGYEPIDNGEIFHADVARARA